MEEGVFFAQNVEEYNGTFSGCLENIYQSLEEFFNSHILRHIPNVVLDQRTSLDTKLSYLRGQSKTFIVRGEKRQWVEPPTNRGIFTEEGARFLDDIINNDRLNLIRAAINYPVLLHFDKIKVKISPTHVLILSPSTSRIIVRPFLSTEEEGFDMVPSNRSRADLIIEHLPEKAYGLVILYGTRKFFFPINRAEYYFGVILKTFYFQFCIPRLLERLLVA